MKTKYVLVLDEKSFLPVGLEHSCCYIFDNFDDAKSFFKEKGYGLDVYSDDSLFSIHGVVSWHGSVYKGLYF